MQTGSSDSPGSSIVAKLPPPCTADMKANAEALKEGTRLLSAYHLRDGVKIWVITEWDRSVTTALLPEEY
jgi:hypothetical protein